MLSAAIFVGRFKGVTALARHKSFTIDIMHCHLYIHEYRKKDVYSFINLGNVCQLVFYILLQVSKLEVTSGGLRNSVNRVFAKLSFNNAKTYLYMYCTAFMFLIWPDFFFG